METPYEAQKQGFRVVSITFRFHDIFTMKTTFFLTSVPCYEIPTNIRRLIKIEFSRPWSSLVVMSLLFSQLSSIVLFNSVVVGRPQSSFSIQSSLMVPSRPQSYFQFSRPRLYFSIQLSLVVLSRLFSFRPRSSFLIQSSLVVLSSLFQFSRPQSSFQFSRPRSYFSIQSTTVVFSRPQSSFQFSRPRTDRTTQQMVPAEISLQLLLFEVLSGTANDW